MPELLLAKILTALILLVIAAPIGWLFVRSRTRQGRAARRRRMSEPDELEVEAYGDTCDWPLDRHQPGGQGRAPETGSGLHAGRKS